MKERSCHIVIMREKNDNRDDSLVSFNVNIVLSSDGVPFPVQQWKIDLTICDKCNEYGYSVV